MKRFFRRYPETGKTTSGFPTLFFPFKRRVSGLLALLFLTSAAYLPVTRAGFIWDDGEYVYLNPAVRAPDGIPGIWADPQSSPYYYPTTFSVFWLEYRLWGDHPLGYHLVNLIFHLLDAVLLVSLLIALRIRGALIAGIVFALHPVQVASVAWVTELKNLLSAAFSLSALLFWLKQRHRIGWWYGLSLFFFVLGMLAKPVVCGFPILLLFLIGWKRRPVWRREVLLTGPFFLASLGFSVFTLLWESRNRLAMDTAYQLNLFERIVQANRNLGFYFTKLVWPDPLLAIYPKQTGDLSLHSFVIPLTLILLYLLPRRTAFYRSKKSLTVGVFGMIVFLVPVSGLASFSGRVYGEVFTHHLYHATACYSALSGSVMFSLSRRIPSRSRLPRSVPVLVIAMVFGVLTWAQAGVYRNPLTLFAHNVAITPESVHARIFYGDALEKEGELSLAEQQYAEALEKAPGSSRAHYRMAQLQARLGNSESAFSHLKQAVRSNPLDARSRFSLGWAYLNRKEYIQAQEQFSYLIRMRPEYWSAYIPHADSLLAQGKKQEALDTLEAVLEIRPDYSEAEHRLALLLLDLGRWREALDHFHRALERSPDEGFRRKPTFTRSLVRLARRVSENGDRDSAREILRVARQIWPQLEDLKKVRIE